MLTTAHALLLVLLLQEFNDYMAKEGSKRQDIAQLRGEVQAFASEFPMPGAVPQ